MSRTKRTQRGRRTELSEHQTLETRLEHYRREGKEHRMRTLMWGTVGSIMIMLGSYGPIVQTSGEAPLLGPSAMTLRGLLHAWYWWRQAA